MSAPGLLGSSKSTITYGIENRLNKRNIKYLIPFLHEVLLYSLEQNLLI